MGTKILIGNLPPDTTAEELREEFVHAGAPILNIEMVPQTVPGKTSAIAELDIEWTIAKIMETQPRMRMFKGRRLKFSVLTEVH